MNKERRVLVRKVLAKIQESSSDLQRIIDDESDCIDNIPENLADSRRAEAAEEALDNMTDASELLSEALDKLEEVV